MLSLDLAEAAGAVAAGGVAGVVWPNAKAGMAIPIRMTSVRDASFTWHLPCVVTDYSTFTLAAFTTFDHFAIPAIRKRTGFLNHPSARENRHSRQLSSTKNVIASPNRHGGRECYADGSTKKIALWGNRSVRRECPLLGRFATRQKATPKQPLGRYSITWSARMSNGYDMVRPSAFSSGLSPARI